jgi:hypothetical protein
VRSRESGQVVGCPLNYLFCILAWQFINPNYRKVCRKLIIPIVIALHERASSGEAIVQ